MAPKKKPSSEKNSSGRTISGSSSSPPTPDIPHQLLHWKMMKYRSWGSYGVTKSWKLPSKRCNAGNGSDTKELQISGDIHERLLKVQDYFYLKKTSFLPLGFYTHLNEKLSISTLHGSFSNSIMLLTGVFRPSLLFVRLQYSIFPCSPTPVECLDLKLTDPYDPKQQYIIFTNAIGFQGKFYALSLYGALAVIEEVDSKFTLTGMSKNRAIPSMPSKQFIEYLIKSDGEILLVFLMPRIEYVEVMKLDLMTMLWVKMDNLGDKALFLAGTADQGMSVSANQAAFKSSQVEYKRNHVYFTHQGINCWKEFDLGSKNIVSNCCNF